MLNKKRILLLLLSSVLSVTTIGCENKIEENKEEIKIETVDIKKNESDIKTETKKDSAYKENYINKNLYNENDVINYFLEIEKEISNELEKEDSLFDNIKEKCTLFVLFMSNEKEIKGYTWSELTNETKEKIIEIFINIDKKMCEKYPDYMFKLKDYSKKVSVFVTDTYKQLKEKANEIIDENIEEKTQEEITNSFKDGYEDLTDSIDKGLEFIKKWAKSNS